MIHAYDELYLERARTNLGRMLDFAVYDLKYSLENFWDLFLNSKVVKLYERGDSTLIAGKSGVEITYEVLGDDVIRITPLYTANRSKEYWTGWALAYYQWMTGLSFENITKEIKINEISDLYSPYHEMDIRHFCDRMNELYESRKHETNLKRLRNAAGYSQSELANQTGIPVRTIQQYEQKQKNINKAQVEYVIKLSRALYCAPEDLLEI